MMRRYNCEKRKGRLRALSALLALLTALFCLSCGTETPDDSGTPEPDKGFLSVGFSTLGSRLNPFFVTTECEETLMGLTQLRLLTLDRVGDPVRSGIEGETRSYMGQDYFYDGICDISVSVSEDTGVAEYLVRLRPGLCFSDGTPVTADDVIFSFYVVCDPSYDGPSTAKYSKISGLGSYLTQTDPETYATAAECFDLIRSAGYGHLWSEDDGWTQEEQACFDAAVAEEWKKDLLALCDYCVISFADEYAADLLGLPAVTVRREEYHVAFAMAAWGFATQDEEGNLVTSTGSVYTMKDNDMPGTDDFYNEVYTLYNGDPEAYYNDVNGGEIDSDSVTDAARNAFITAMGGGGMEKIKGVKKLSELEVSFTADSYDAADIYNIFDFYVAPKAWYGDPEAGLVGVMPGDLSSVTARDGAPLGGGQYVYSSGDDSSLILKANDRYYGGAPKLREIRLIRTVGDPVEAIESKKADVMTFEGNALSVSALEALNSGGTLSGDAAVTRPWDVEYYGYIGINADTVAVGGDPDGESSVLLRTGLATLFSAYREAAVSGYYGSAARVVDYPVSSTSYFVPAPGDSDYSTAFARTVKGEPVYSEDMTGEGRYSAALAAARDYFIAAGFEFDAGTGKFVSAPEGSTLEFEVTVPGGGKGDHPCFAIMKKASEALYSIGITLNISDPESSSVLWEKLSEGKQQIWCAARPVSAEPDIYASYHSKATPENGGKNYSRIADDVLDFSIITARAGSDKAFRKVTYRQCVDIILEYAIELPVYRRQSFTVFSAKYLDPASIPASITCYYPWYREAGRLKSHD